MKKVLYIFLISLVGCASQMKPYDDIQNTSANCITAKTQIEYLTTQIKLYQDAHRGQTSTDEDRKYIGKAKNVIWSLRSTCPANYL